MRPEKIFLNEDLSKSGHEPRECVDSISLNVLVVDDDETNRIVLESMLQRDGHMVYSAKDGREAVSLYKARRPDLILMDVMMPIMDGYEATRRIKALAGSHFIPVTFLTALTDESSLVKCLEVGGDDFIVKPVSRVILRAKLAAAARIHGLYVALERQQHDLSIHHERLRYEHEVAENIFTKVMGSDKSEAANIRSEALPFAITNGDFMLVAQTPAGGQHVLLGDYTGHGLSAAIGAIPATETFHAMTRKGLGLREIVSEMNRKLHATLPTGQYLAACMLEWNPRLGIVRAWNGGLPDVIIVSGQGRGLARIPSRNIPLGIMGDGEVKHALDVRQIDHGDRIYLYSDGLIEARNKDGVMFGEERLEKVMSANDDREHLFDEVREAVAQFRGGRSQDDDITMVEMLCDEALLEGGVASEKNFNHKADYRLSIRLGPQALKGFDPLFLVEDLIKGVGTLERYRSDLYTIVAELYANALEHGVLGMDSTLKETPEGFAEYYAERERLLSGLDVGWMHVDIEYLGNSSAGELILQIEDSGKGFDSYGACKEVCEEYSARANGRGLELVRSLCEGLSHDPQGNYVRAVYAW